MLLMCMFRASRRGLCSDLIVRQLDSAGQASGFASSRRCTCPVSCSVHLYSTLRGSSIHSMSTSPFGRPNIFQYSSKQTDYFHGVKWPFCWIHPFLGKPISLSHLANISAKHLHHKELREGFHNPWSLAWLNAHHYWHIHLTTASWLWDIDPNKFPQKSAVIEKGFSTCQSVSIGLEQEREGKWLAVWW